MGLIVAGKEDQFPVSNKLEIALIGRSNAGKSTLINALLRSEEAFISKKPGKTKTINFFPFKNYYLVDMPGYGFSKNRAHINTKIGHLITRYFSNREQLRGIIHICSLDTITEQDIEMILLLSSLRSNYTLVLNKIDKYGRQQQLNFLNKAIIQTRLKEDQICLISAKKGTNVKEIVRKIVEWVAY